MPSGTLYFGPGGFQYKKAGGAGGRKNPPLGLLNCSSTRFYNDYIPGAGVGATSIASRRAKIVRATKCSTNYPCYPSFSKLGLYASGGSNKYALNWLINYNAIAPYNQGHPSLYIRNPSSNSNPSPISTVPSQPLNVSAVSNSTGQATVTFSPPTSDGGAQVTSYTVTANPETVPPVTGASSPITLTGLTTSAVPYVFYVVATNSVGNSDPSDPSNTVIPL